MSQVDILVLGHILNPQSDRKCEFYKNGAMCLKAKKSQQKTVYIVKSIGKARDLLKEIKKDCLILDYSDSVIIPPFFDMHFHWVQDDVREMPKANLLKWLENYTFPAENKFKDKQYAKEKAKIFFKRLTETGTLGGACYSSIHEHAHNYAQDYALGDFVIGNVLMTQNSPDYLTQTKKQAVQLVDKLSGKYKKRYALTPRFAIATDGETMKESAKLAKKNGSFIQTHLSETKNEIEFVKSLYQGKTGFRNVETYTDVYHKAGLLGPRTIMGHGIHLEKSELTKLEKSKTAIAHCPTSNAPLREKGLGSGLFDFKRVEKNNIRWALASDIGGGPILSMFDVMRSFVDQNKKAAIKGATAKKALYRATLAGAEILKVDKRVGNLNPGKEASFLVLPAIKDQDLKSVETVLESYFKKGRRTRKKYDSLVEKVFCQGQLVFSKS